MCQGGAWPQVYASQITQHLVSFDIPQDFTNANGTGGEPATSVGCGLN